ncbi:MAG: hypothetical protein AAF078_07825, partial [Planctomycetota bacterium]
MDERSERSLAERLPLPPSAAPPLGELLALPMAEVYKQDRRSMVWRVDHARGSYVIKRFEYSSWRQRAGHALGNHPAQRELRAGAMLMAQSVPVVPVRAAGWDGGRFCLATSYFGPTLQSALQNASGQD